ncbi:MAG TPA: DUF2231 domain-containing protein [Clostridia bacterium]|nr:DUF2231 domain-containing protein [Clostridia bacterium]
MESHFKAAGHAVHPMLIVFPLGLLATATIFDGIRAATHERRWAEVGHYMLGAGVVSGLVAAVPGTVDYLAIRENTRAKRIGLLHGIGNVIVTGMFAASWLARRDNPGRPGPGAIGLSVGGTALALVTAWLGGELVERLGIGVDDGAHMDAPNSLSDRPATDQMAA